MKDLGFYIVFMVCGLGAAYVASLPQEEGSDEKVAIFNLNPKNLSSLKYSSESVQVALTPKEKRFWIDFEKTEDALDRPVPGKEGDAPKNPEKKVTKQSFLGSEAVNEILEGFNPLYALRVIGKGMKSEDLVEFGLKDPKETIVVKGEGSEELTVRLGKKSYGSRNRFVHESKGDRVILLDGKPFETLERANFRLFERKLIGENLDDISHVLIKTPKGTKRLDHTQRNAKGKLQWSDDMEGAKPKSTYMSFMNKIGRLRLMAYATNEELPKLANLVPFIEITFESAGAVKDTLGLFKSQGEKPEYWVKSQFLGTFGKLSANRIAPIEGDIARIVGESK